MNDSSTFLMIIQKLLEEVSVSVLSCMLNRRIYDLWNMSGISW
jgi:hypothetical protein